MIDQIFKRAGAVERQLAAPFAQSRSDYLAHCAAAGAKSTTLGNVARTLLAVVRYVELDRPGKVPLFELEDAAARWAAQDPGRRGGEAKWACQRFVRYASGWLRFAGRLEAPATVVPSYAALVAEFTDHMRSDMGWSEATVRSYRDRVAAFLGRCCRGKRTVAETSVSDIDRILSEKGAAGDRSRITLRNDAAALKAFFRYAERRGWCAPGLSASITTPRIYRDAGLPAGPSPDEVRRLLATTTGGSPADLRDRAVLLLLSAYGLRAGEVCALRLEDIDWEAETLRVRRSKTGVGGLFPLTRSLGEALLRYLREARPRCPQREIFLTLKAPVLPLHSTGISCIVRRRMRRIGVDRKRCAAHSLRHAFAQRLLDEGFSLRQIGDCLGHRSLAATTVYAKVGLVGLRQVADFDLEGLA